jgi:hypothetical protein
MLPVSLFFFFVYAFLSLLFCFSFSFFPSRTRWILTGNGWLSFIIYYWRLDDGLYEHFETTAISNAAIPAAGAGNESQRMAGWKTAGVVFSSGCSSSSCLVLDVCAATFIVTQLFLQVVGL